MSMAPSREKIAALVTERLRRLLATRGVRTPVTLGDDTIVIGAPSAVLDSLGWVIFVLDIEQQLEDHGVPDAALTTALDSKGVLDAVTLGGLMDLIERVSHNGA